MLTVGTIIYSECSAVCPIFVFHLAIFLFSYLKTVLFIYLITGFTQTWKVREIIYSVGLLVLHWVSSQVVDKVMLSRYGRYWGNKTPGADQN